MREERRSARARPRNSLPSPARVIPTSSTTGPGGPTSHSPVEPIARPGPCLARPCAIGSRRGYYTTYGTAPGSQALKDALTALAGIARFDGDCRPVFVRLAGADNEIYLDLGNDDWEVVRITADGWDIIPAADAAVRFRRPGGMLPAGASNTGRKTPDPAPAGQRQERRGVCLGCCLAARRLLRPSGPYTMLYLAGEQGTAKTTLARMLRSSSTLMSRHYEPSPARKASC